MIEPRYPFEDDEEYKCRVVLDKLAEGLPLTEEEKKIVEKISKSNFSTSFSDEDYGKLDLIEEKIADGLELTKEEEQLYLDMVINGGDNMFGATT